jgi:hypothetical protein
MRITNNKEERKEQKEVLKNLYPDYIPTRHDAFVMRYNTEKEKEALKDYMVDRGIIKKKQELYKTAQTLVACAEFGKGEFVSVKYDWTDEIGRPINWRTTAKRF